jgi:hypothetical protein
LCTLEWNTFVCARVLITQDCQLHNLPILLKDGPQLVLIDVLGKLPHKQLGVRHRAMQKAKKNHHTAKARHFPEGSRQFAQESRAKRPREQAESLPPSKKSKTCSAANSNLPSGNFENPRIRRFVKTENFSPPHRRFSLTSTSLCSWLLCEDDGSIPLPSFQPQREWIAVYRFGIFGKFEDSPQSHPPHVQFRSGSHCWARD